MLISVVETSDASLSQKLLDCIPKKGEKKFGISKDLWVEISRDASITVEQYRRGGNIAILKEATHLEDSGRKEKGINQQIPVTSFFIKSFSDNVVVLSGYSVSGAANGTKQSKVVSQSLSPNISNQQTHHN